MPIDAFFFICTTALIVLGIASAAAFHWSFIIIAIAGLWYAFLLRR